MGTDLEWKPVVENLGKEKRRRRNECAERARIERYAYIGEQLGEKEMVREDKMESDGKRHER